MKTVSYSLAVLLTASVFLTFSPQARTAGIDENWPGWRGPDGLGVAKGTAYADEWSAEKNIAWKAPIEGRGPVPDHIHQG